MRSVGVVLGVALLVVYVVIFGTAGATWPWYAGGVLVAGVGFAVYRLLRRC